jgi:hypothetical protein
MTPADPIPVPFRRAAEQRCPNPSSSGESPRIGEARGIWSRRSGNGGGSDSVQADLSVVVRGDHYVARFERGLLRPLVPN